MNIYAFLPHLRSGRSKFSSNIVLQEALMFNHNYLYPYRVFFLFFVTLCGLNGYSQVKINSTNGCIQLDGPDLDISEDLGQLSGPNLFFDFEEFSLQEGDIATFSGPDMIANIFSGVTGGSQSEINGRINSEIPGANFFLINPRGVIFGEKASVNVSGSFTVSTADIIHFSDGGRFDVSNPANTVLTTSPPTAFGFLNNNQQGSDAIRLSGTQLSSADDSALNFIGGDIHITNGKLTTIQGDISLISTISSGEIPYDASEMRFNIAESTVSERGSIEIINRTEITINGDGAGKLEIDGEMVVLDSSTIVAQNNGTGNGEGITISSNTLDLSNQAQISSTTFMGLGDGSDINLNSDEIRLGGGSAVATASILGVGGDISVNANRLIIQDSAQISTNAFGQFNAGAVSVNLENLDINNGGTITASTFGIGNGGDISIKAKDITLTGNETIPLTGIVAQSIFIPQAGLFGEGNGGSITIDTNTLTISDGSGISATTNSTGDGGTISLDATKVVVSDKLSTIFTGIAAQSQSSDVDSGDAGEIVITTSEFELLTGGTVSTVTAGGGSSGDVTIDADALRISGGRLSSTTFGTGKGGDVHIISSSILMEGKEDIQFTGIDAQTQFAGLEKGGNAGAIDIIADSLELTAGAQISTSTFNNGGKGGNIHVKAQIISLAGSNSNAPTSINAQTQNGSDGGTITLEGGKISIAEHAEVNAESFADGPGGITMIKATDLLIRDNGSVISSSLGNGNAGDIDIDVSRSARLNRSGIISTSATTANGGSINIGAPVLEVFASSIRGDAQIDGGDVSIEAETLVHLINGSIDVQAGRNGGNITIDPKFVILDGSNLVARAIEGNGGDITVISEVFLTTPNSAIDASSEKRLPGEITIAAPDIDIAGSLAVLPSSFVKTGEKLVDHCAERSEENISSFIVSGHGGLPIQPINFLPAFHTDRN